MPTPLLLNTISPLPPTASSLFSLGVTVTGGLTNNYVRIGDSVTLTVVLEDQNGQPIPDTALAAVRLFVNTVSPQPDLQYYWPASAVAPPPKTPYPSVVLGDGPSLYLPLNDTPSIFPSVLAAVPAPGSEAYAGGGVTYGTTGPFGPGAETAFAFDGTSGFVSVGQASNVTGSISLEAWVNYTSATIGTNGAAIIANGAGGGPSGYNFYFNGFGSPVIAVANATANVAAPEFVDLRQTGWHHIVATWDGTTLSIYRDGVLRNTTVNPVGGVASAPRRATIGAYPTSDGRGPAGNFWNGQIAQVALYGYALSASQVVNHYAARVLTPGVVPQNQIALTHTPSSGVWTATVTPQNAGNYYFAWYAQATAGSGVTGQVQISRGQFSAF